MLKIKKKGQTTLEYLILLTVIIGAFLAVGNYVKRGIQGRWKSAIDDMGEQYDPRVANAFVRHTMSAQQNTVILSINAVEGTWTSRTDSGNTVDSKGGFIAVGSY
ncbi:MAG TPA: class III signal peptide-containing protein [Gammaproteobacteria bacterium]|nr:class III signal peptide-containing protein [Gammaproteobacteria bacterium]